MGETKAESGRREAGGRRQNAESLLNPMARLGMGTCEKNRTAPVRARAENLTRFAEIFLLYCRLEVFLGAEIYKHFPYAPLRARF